MEISEELDEETNQMIFFIDIPELFLNDGDEEGNGKGFKFENIEMDDVEEILINGFPP